MNPSEAAKVLAMAVTLDPRLKPPSVEDAQARAVAWSATLDDDLPLQVAERLVAEHYRESTDGLMPAHLNRAWRAHRKQALAAQREEAERRAITSAAAMAVPMPETVRQMLREALKSTESP